MKKTNGRASKLAYTERQTRAGQMQAAQFLLIGFNGFQTALHTGCTDNVDSMHPGAPIQTLNFLNLTFLIALGLNL